MGYPLYSGSNTMCVATALLETGMVALALLPGLARYAMMFHGVESGLVRLMELALIAFAGVGAAWLAVVIDRVLKRRGRSTVSAI